MSREMIVDSRWTQAFDAFEAMAAVDTPAMRELAGELPEEDPRRFILILMARYADTQQLPLVQMLDRTDQHDRVRR